MEKKLPSYGGQAVIEGVMMRSTKTYAIAVRAPDQSIVTDTQPLGALYQSKLVKVPFLRGLLTLWDTLVLGMHALTFSANLQAGEEEQIEAGTLTLTLVSSLALGIGLFFLLPVGIAHLAELILHWSPWWSNVLEGLIRLGLLVGYIWAIGFVPDIRRVYGYHGAEHKTINAFNAGATLDIDTVKMYPREHIGCGTAFLLTVVVFSILLFSGLGPLPLLPRFASRLLLIPVLASLAYEYIRLSAKLARFWWGKLLLAPNLWLQRLSTAEPDPAMIEVAITAFQTMRAQEDTSQATVV
jgi:uncharacterized protein YqhQ